MHRFREHSLRLRVALKKNPAYVMCLKIKLTIDGLNNGIKISCFNYLFQLSYLMEYDVQSKVMRLCQECEDGDRPLLRDGEGDFESITNVHIYDQEHPYWKQLRFWVDIDPG